MNRKLILLITAFILAASAFGQNPNQESPKINTDPEKAQIVTSDIDLFWKAYDKATPENNLLVYRDEYLKKGSVGLEAFRILRIGNSCNLVDAIERYPQYYASLRASSAKVKQYESRMRASFRRLKEIYPEAVFPDVYFLIGRMNSAGTLTPKGLLIGVDMFGKTDEKSLEGMNDWHKAVVSSIERVPFIVAHELIHYQQKNSYNQTLLARSLGEGVADFVAQLISGEHINPHLHKFGDPREKELWLEFKKEMAGSDVSNWMYQGEKATKEKPADLGYYMGYKIAESYYKNAKDKKQAVKDILEIKDFEKFLADSKHEEKFKSE